MLILGDKVINLFKGLGCFSVNISVYSLDWGNNTKYNIRFIDGEKQNWSDHYVVQTSEAASIVIGDVGFQFIRKFLLQFNDN